MLRRRKRYKSEKRSASCNIHTCQIGEVTEEPYKQEDERDAIGAIILVVFNELRDLEGECQQRIVTLSGSQRLTNRQTHVARLMLPKTPDKASFVVRSCDKSDGRSASVDAMIE